MADQSTPPTQPQQQATGLPIVVNAQYIKDLSFENPNAPQIFGMTNASPNLDVHVDLQTRSGPQDSYEVTIVIKAQAKTDSTIAFVIELAYAGLFTLQGVPPEALPRLFEPFYRPEVARGRNTGGSGLGLAIVKRCVSACGGTVAARLREPQGLEVEIVV